MSMTRMTRLVGVVGVVATSVGVPAGASPPPGAGGPLPPRVRPVRLTRPLGPVPERPERAARLDRRARGARARGDSVAQVPLTEALLRQIMTFHERWFTRKLPERVTDTLATRPEYQQPTYTLVVRDVKGLLLPFTFSQQLDWARLAAAAPEVAALLREVKLTARQLEQGLRSLYLAVLTSDVDKAAQRHREPATPSHRSLTWQNVEFVRAHRALVDTVEQKGWVPHIDPSAVPLASDTVNQHPY